MRRIAAMAFGKSKNSEIRSNKMKLKEIKHLLYLRKLSLFVFIFLIFTSHLLHSGIYERKIHQAISHTHTKLALHINVIIFD